ncbi:MAG TPA: cupin [Deltaproteobacteria bacterium]|nr:cupin [Deltaproteobacteria bacterium]
MDIVRFNELIPCRTAFIDAHTPGSDQKENYTIIGAGVSESPDQHVHLRKTPGFNIGAAAQPAGCTNSLHSHRTAEVFIIHSGNWRFFWGLYGDKGEVVLDPGDVISLPTHMFRGFENITEKSESNPNGYGFMFAVLGGNDSGGGVLWAPKVIETAQTHGLVLLENGLLIDTHNGESIPDGMLPRKPLEGADLVAFDQNNIENPSRVLARKSESGNLILGTSDSAKIREIPGFEICRTLGFETLQLKHSNPAVLICNDAGFQIGDQLIEKGDVVYLDAGELSTIEFSSACEVFLITPTLDPAGPTKYL